jgi:hypothetical protein
MFILSYFRKKQTIKVKEDTLENLDDDFIVISDTLNSTPFEEENTVPHHRGETDKKEQTVKNIDNSIEENVTLFSVPYDKRDEENDSISFSASRQGSLFETSSSLRSQRRDEENQLIENTKDEHYKKLSLCDEIMKKIQSVYQIFNEKLERALN